MKPSRVKKAAKKPAGLLKKFDYAKEFLKDWVALDRSGVNDMNRVKEAIHVLISSDGLVPAEWRDHELTGEWADHRVCHVKGDLLLIYSIRGDRLLLARLGTHAQLFRR